MARPSARVIESALSFGLGPHLRSWRWTKYHLLVFAAFTGALAIGYIPYSVKLLSDARRILPGLGLVGAALAVAIVLLGLALQAGLFWFTFHLARGGIAGIGRSLHLYEHGLVTARWGSPTVTRWADLRAINVERSSTPTTGSFDVSVTLIERSGRTVVVDKRSAIASVTSAARHGSGITATTSDRSTGGPDFPANSGGPEAA